MSSIRTIKSDIALLNSALKAEHTGSIESRRSRGYRFVPGDSDLYKRFEESLQIQHILFRWSVSGG